MNNCLSVTNFNKISLIIFSLFELNVLKSKNFDGQKGVKKAYRITFFLCAKSIEDDQHQFLSMPLKNVFEGFSIDLIVRMMPVAAGLFEHIGTIPRVLALLLLLPLRTIELFGCLLVRFHLLKYCIASIDSKINLRVNLSKWEFFPQNSIDYHNII